VRSQPLERGDIALLIRALFILIGAAWGARRVALARLIVFIERDEVEAVIARDQREPLRLRQLAELLVHLPLAGALFAVDLHLEAPAHATVEDLVDHRL
jgi:hypothetical protein